MKAVGEMPGDGASKDRLGCEKRESCMRWRSWVLLAACLGAPVGARAGVVLGVGSGIARPSGSIVDGGRMQEFTSFMVPIELQAGWTFADRLTVTGLVAVEAGKVAGRFGDTCRSTGDDCYVTERRLGGQVRWSFRPDRRLDPWVGAGVAHEWLGITHSTSKSGSGFYYQGIGWDVLGGADWWVTTRFSLSAWMGLSVGRYGEFAVDEINPDWQPIPARTTHALLTAGLRIGWTFGAAPRSDEPLPSTSP